MFYSHEIKRITALLVVLLLLTTGITAQKKKKNRPAQKAQPSGTAIMWEPVRGGKRDLYYGPGGKEMMPDLSSIKFIKKETGGHQKKYRIEDGSGRIWVAKLGSEARPETAATRLLWGLGYKNEINYLVPTLTIPGKGTFKNVRLEARPSNVERQGRWKWGQNPFTGTNELQGLKIMQVFMTNWDVLDQQNVMLEVKNKNGQELQYVVSDYGATFGKYGNNNLPIFYRLDRQTGSPRHYARASFIKGVKNGHIQFAVKGKNRGIYKDITISQARWLLGQLQQLDDRQIEDAFRAANYSPAEIDMFRAAVKRRIAELDRITSDTRLAGVRK